MAERNVPEPAELSEDAFVVSFADGNFQKLEQARTDILASVVPVVIRHANALRPLGTAFAIASLHHERMLYATARHVVIELAAAPPGTEAFVFVPRGLTTEDARHFTGVRIEHIAMIHPYSDAALLVVDLSSSALLLTYVPNAFPLTVARPAIGQRCLALGYSDMQVDEFDADTGAFRQPLHASQGIVEEVHPRGRDRVMIDFPSFRTDATYRSGMSGGPIINEQGYVIGFVSSSYDHGAGADRGTSYGALTATLAEIKVDIREADGVVREHTLGAILNNGDMPYGEAGSTVTLTRGDDGVAVVWPDLA